ncbi:MAG: multiheme c-type cytochrome [Planctomycetota bacterium]
MPPPPELQWGKPVDGLRYGIAIDPPQGSIGDDVVIMMKFENTSSEVINLLYQSADAAKNLEIKNGDGQMLTIEAESGPFARMRRRRNRVDGIKEIEPGKSFETEMQGKIAAASTEVTVSQGNYSAISNYEMSTEKITQIDKPSEVPLWIGKLSSGTYMLNIGMARKETCADCHGDTDYHHSDFQKENCNNCHVGQAGKDDFGMRTDSCNQCHLREDEKGRRQILGPGGEFDMASKHISGSIEDGDCLLCHDYTQHGKGLVVLVSHDDKTETVTESGPSTSFCLNCHDGDPPEGVVFPEESKGSGFDKSGFEAFGHGQGGPNCSFCHYSHGSNLLSLLKNMHHRE